MKYVTISCQEIEKMSVKMLYAAARYTAIIKTAIIQSQQLAASMAAIFIDTRSKYNEFGDT
jgi:hypothetical protein